MKKILSLVTILSVLELHSVKAEDVNVQLQELQQALALHPDDTNILNTLGAKFYQTGKFVEAESLFLHSLLINEKRLGKNHPEIATCLNNLAAIYQAQGKYRQAEFMLLRVLAIDEKSLGKYHQDAATSLNNLAEIYRTQGKYKQAASLLLRVLMIDEKNLGKYHPDVATTLNNLAEIYRSQGKYEQAESMFLRVQAIDEKNLGKNHPDIATTLNNLALVYQTQGKFILAESLFQKSLVIWTKTFGKEHPQVATGLNNLAMLYQREGKYNLVEPLLQNSLVIFEKALGKVHPQVATSLNNLAAFYRVQGNFELAEPLLLHSLVINEKIFGKEHPQVAINLNNLAGLYKLQGKHEQAEPFYQRSLAIYEKSLGKDHPDVAMSLNNLALLYFTQGKYEQAEPFYRRSLAICEKSLGKDHSDVAMNLNNLALLYFTQGKYEQAEPFYQRSLAIYEKALGKDHADVAMILNNLAGLHQEQGRYTDAESLFQRSLIIYEKALGKEHSSVALTLVNLAILYSAQNKYNQAKALFQRSLRIMNGSLDRWLWGAGEKTRQSYLQQQEGERNSYLSFYSLHNTPEEALYFSLSRKGLLLRISSEVSTLAKQSPDPLINKLTQDFNALRAQLSTLYFSGKANQAEIQALEEKSNELERQLSQKVSRFKRSKTEVTPTQVLKNLKPDQSVVDFLVYTAFDFKTQQYTTEQIIALVANKQHGIRLVKLGEYVPIARVIKDYRAAIDRKQPLDIYAKDLYAALWQPLNGFIKNTQTIYLIPDGQLHLLPFKTLQDQEGSYLASKHQLINLSSARDIVLSHETGTNTQSVIYADPDYGNNESPQVKATNRGIKLSDLYFKQLPATLKEGQQIEQLFKQKQPNNPAQLFVKQQATELAVAQAPSPKILHLATHGFYLKDIPTDEKTLPRDLMLRSTLPLPLANIQNPLARSGLALTGANLGVKGIKQADQTDGILTALDVLNLNLEGTDLATLSACETGVGELVFGEGVYSLNRAFQEAGAKSVLSTLWKVDDEATGLFMQQFYVRFLGGQSTQQAIQETQQEFMKHKDYSHPYYWAGFVMTGK